MIKYTYIAGSSTCPAKFMVLLYILENNSGKHYIGITSQTLEERLAKHNKGEVYSTKFGRLWKVIYWEKYANFKIAREREKQIKSWHGGNALKKLIGIAVGSANGRPVGSEPINLGSNPSPTALPTSLKFGGVK